MIKNPKSELAYMGGLFDGEGCITIRRWRNNSQFVLDCSIGMTNEYVPQLFRFHFNGSIHQRKTNLDKPQWHTFWQWQVMSRKALNFLEIIYPFLRLKKAEAEVAIDFQKRLKWQGGKSLTNDEIAYREAQKILLSSLKDKTEV